MSLLIPCIFICVSNLMESRCLQEEELAGRQNRSMDVARLVAEQRLWQRENMELYQHILSLQSEVYGARLASRYLDKELAGR